MSQPSEEKPKLIIDEDWKTQVEREREQLRQSPSASVDAASDSGQSSSEVRDTTDANDEIQQLPPPPTASLPFLVSMLGTQALAAMGQLGEREDAPAVQLDYAKHYIDLLGVLEEKTKGNLTTEEAALLRDWLYQLRLGFVELSKHR